MDLERLYGLQSELSVPAATMKRDILLINDAIRLRTGWPSRGSSNGKAVASASDAKLALSNINCACRADRSVSVYAFEGDDQIWKGNDWERSFGIFGKYNLGGEVFSTC